MRQDDFRFLRQNDTVYLDSACMSLRPDTVVKEINKYYYEYPGCPGRSGHKMGREAGKKVEKAREQVSDFIDCSSDSLVFTSGTTESINIVAQGFKPQKVIISDREHNSNLVPWQKHAEQLEIIPTKGGFDLEKLQKEVSEGDLVSVVHTSNLDGYRLPVEEIVEIAHEEGAYTMVDAAQAVSHTPFSAEKLEADFIAFSGHKMLGPSGTGGLYVSDRGKEVLDPVKVGGGAVENTGYRKAEFKEFPHSFEAGLPNTAGIIGMGDAARYLEDIGMEKVRDHQSDLTEELDYVLESYSEIETVGERGVGVRSFRVKSVDSHQVSELLDRRNIAVRSGRHCLHAWFNRYKEDPTVRVSLHLYNTERDVEKFGKALKKICLLS